MTATGPITAGWETVDDLRGQFLNNGRYRLLDLLGLGGPSEVWLAHDTHLDRQVAIKTLRADADAGWAALTAHEASTLAQIDHPHVVPIYDSFAERDKPWIVMRFIRGRTLADILEADGPLPEDKLWDVARALASALAASHRVGIVHRDLKPANVMIGHDNTIWLVDFGIALRGPAGELAASRKAVGTLAYMAPESLSGHPDRPADLWSLGVLLLTLATGVNPFVRPDPLATAGAILHAPVPDLPVPSLQAVGRRLLERNPARRPTADQLAAELCTGVPDRIAPDAAAVAADHGLFRRLWPTRPASDRAAAEPAPAPAVMPATRADSRLARTGMGSSAQAYSGMAYWGMSRVINHSLERPRPEQPDSRPSSRPMAVSPPPVAAPARPIETPPRSVVPPPPVRDRVDRRSPTTAVRRATAVTLPVLGGWATQTVAAFAGFWLGLLCLVPADLPLPHWPVLPACVAVAVAAACLSAGRPHASTGPWLTVTVGWAVLVSVGTTTAAQVGPVAAGAVPLLALGAAVGVRRICATPAAADDGSSPGPNAAVTVTALAAALAVAVGPAAANGVVVLAGRPAATGTVLVAAWAVALIGVAITLGRRAPGLPDLLISCAGVLAGFTTTAVLATGIPVWQDAFGPSTDWSAATRWWAYGLAAAVLAVGLAGQVRLGRSIRMAGPPDRPGGPSPTAAGRSIGRLSVLVLGSLTAAAVGAAAGVAVMAWADSLSLPPLLFVVPVTAAGYIVALAGCTRMAADPPRRVDHRNPERYAWVAGWTAVLTVVLALLPHVLTPVLPHLDAAGLAVAVAVCTVAGGVVGQLPVDRAFRWTRRQTGPALARQAVRLAAQLASAAVGLAVALVVLAQLDGVESTPQGAAVAVLVAGFGIAAVDLARAGTPASCVFVLLGVAVGMGAACWLQAEIDGRFGPGPWSFLQVASFAAGLIAVGAGAVYLVRFAAELTRNTRGERSNHAFSALVLAATAAGIIYGILTLTA